MIGKHYAYKCTTCRAEVKIFHWDDEFGSKGLSEKTIRELSRNCNCPTFDYEYVPEIRTESKYGNVLVLNTFLDPDRFKRTVIQRSRDDYQRRSKKGGRQ